MADAGSGVDPEEAAPAEPARKFKFPTAFTAPRGCTAPRLDRLLLRPGGRVTTSTPRPGCRCPARITSSRPACRSRHAAPLASSRSRARRRAPADARWRRPRRSPESRGSLRRHVVHLSLQAALQSDAERSLRRRGVARVRRPVGGGFLYGSAAIFFFVLAVGAFITVTMKTEAIQTGIGRLALRFRHSGSS